jgi:hypothetical protein
MKQDPITDAQISFKKSYAKPFGPGKRYIKPGLVDAYIVGADQDGVLVDFLHYADSGQAINRNYYFHPTKVPYSAIESGHTKEELIRYFHSDNPEVQQEFQFEGKHRTFKDFLKD